MKVTTAKVICNNRELEALGIIARDMHESYTISQWSDEPMMYLVEISGNLLNYLLESRINVFIKNYICEPNKKKLEL